MTNCLIYLSLCLILNVYNSIYSILLALFFIFFKSFRHKILFILLFILFNIRLNINTCQPIEKGRVVELNNSSILVNHNLTNVLISVNDISQYAIHDEILIYQTQNIQLSPHRYGFNVKNYTQSRNICFSAQESDTYKIEGKGLLHWMSQGGLNSNPEFKQLIRLLLFQSNPDQELDLFISLGLIYSSLIKLIELCFIKVKNRMFESIMISFVFLLIGYSLAWPLSLLRVLIFYLSSKLFNDNLLRFSINCIISSFISPYGLTQVAFVLPLMFQFVSIFFPLKSKFIQRICCLIIVFVSYNHSFSLFSLVLYPILIYVYRYLILFSIMGMFLPVLSYIYIYIIQILDSFIKLTQSLFILKGNISLLFLVFCVLIYHAFQQSKFKTIIIFISVILGIPLFSIPFFYTITMINVGQGDSILIQSPFNRDVILIDTGSSYNMRALQNYLDAQFIYNLDYLIITHDDSDHSGNMEELKQKYQIDEIVLKGKDINSNSLLLKHLLFEQKDLSDNDMSLIYTLGIYNQNFLFMGDLSIAGERKLIQHYPHIKADVVKLGHHGSNTSTSDDFLKQIQTRIALIGVGKNNYGHPSLEVLNRLDDYSIEFFDTYTKGDISIVVLPFIRILLDSNNNIFLY